MFRKSILLFSFGAIVLLSFSHGWPGSFAAEIASLKELQESKAVELYFQGGIFNFKKTQADGSSSDSMENFSNFGGTNISTVKVAKKAVPSWTGNSFSITAEEAGAAGETVLIVINGTLSKDRATMVEATAKKTVKDGKGAVKSMMEWTFKNISGGKLEIEDYSRKRKVRYWKFSIPLNELKNHLVNLKFSEISSGGGSTAFVSIPSMEQLQTAYGGSSLFSTFKEVALSFTFIIDL